MLALEFHPLELKSSALPQSTQAVSQPSARRKFFVCSLVMLMACARAADVGVTYHFSPDLAFEGNPMVRLLGMGWPFLLAANLLAVFAIGACSLSWLHKPLQYPYSSEVHDAWSFASFASFDRVYSRPMFIWKRLICTPKNWKHTIQLFGFVAPVTVVGLSLAAVVSWYAMYSLHWEAFSAFYKALWPVFPYGIVIPLIWVSTAVFYRTEHARYRATSLPVASPVTAETIIEQPALLAPAVAMS